MANKYVVSDPRPRPQHTAEEVAAILAQNMGTPLVKAARTRIRKFVTGMTLPARYDGVIIENGEHVDASFRMIGYYYGERCVMFVYHRIKNP